MADYSYVVTQPFAGHAVGDVLASVDPEQARNVTRVAAPAAPVAPDPQAEQPAVVAAQEAVVAAQAAEHAAEVAAGQEPQ